MQPKVIHILGSLLPGGAELALLRILNEWKDNDFSFSVFYTRDFDQLKPEFENVGVKTTGLGWKNERDFTKIFKLIKLFRKEKPKIVHTHLWTGNYWVVIAARLSGVPIIIETVHDIFHHSKKGIIIHRLLRPIYSSFINFSVYVSKAVNNYIINNFKKPPNSSGVIINGILKRTDSDIEKKEELKFELGLKKETHLLLTIANLIPVKKGYEVYLKAIHSLVKNGIKNIHAVIVGSARDDYPDFLKQLKEKVKDYNIDEYVTFLGYRTDINELLKSADFLVMPSLYEGGPIVVLEAMRAGIPVIATRTGAVPEYIIEGESGLIIEPGNITALAGAIGKLLQHPEKWNTMGDKGKKHFEDNFTIDKTVEKLTKLYRSLLKNKIPFADNI